MPCPTYLSLPCLTSSSQTTCGNWTGGVMATMAPPEPLLSARPRNCESASSCVTLRLLRNAFNAFLRTSGVGGPDDVESVCDMGALLPSIGRHDVVAAI